MNEQEVEVGSAADEAEGEALLRQLAAAGIPARARPSTPGLLQKLLGAKSGRVAILVRIQDRRRAAQTLRQRHTT